MRDASSRSVRRSVVALSEPILLMMTATATLLHFDAVRPDGSAADTFELGLA